MAEASQAQGWRFSLVLVLTLFIVPGVLCSDIGNHGDYGNSTNGNTSEQDDGNWVQVVSWNFAYVEEPLIFGLFIFVTGLLKLGKDANVISYRQSMSLI